MLFSELAGGQANWQSWRPDLCNEWLNEMQSGPSSTSYENQIFVLCGLGFKPYILPGLGYRLTTDLLGCTLPPNMGSLPA